MFILLGKIVYCFVWGFLLLNLVFPYPAPANFIVYIALAALTITHGLQSWLLHSTLTKKEKKEDPYITLRVFLFGMFEAMSWKKKQKASLDGLDEE